jgi:acetyl-CoA carboxylase biotin carboxyl carrier protein
MRRTIMDTKLIKELISMVEGSTITSFEVEEGNLKIRIGKDGHGRAHFGMPGNDFYPRPQGAQFMHDSFASDAVQNENRPSNANANASATDKVSNSEVISPAPAVSDDAGLTDVLSPMLGVFYAAASPESKPFVKVGDKVKKGDILCIIEAMKLMNEILAESDGEIAKICVENGHIVEFGQIIFKIK